MKKSNRTRLLTLMAVAVLVGVTLFSGCTSTEPAAPVTSPPTIQTTNPTPQKTMEPAMPVYTEENDGQSVTMAKDTVFRIVLDENPTTGYSWNATMSAGLALTDSGFIPKDSPPGMVGVGGTHFWEIKAAQTGPQSFSAIYVRPWENVTGNESSFRMNFMVQ